MRPSDGFRAELEAQGVNTNDPDLSVRTHAAAFYVACLKAGLLDEATEFAEWYLDAFDTDLVDDTGFYVR